jgi:phage FluMu gp28-like protein
MSLLDGVWKPHPGQRAFLEAESKFKVLACGRRWGKTDACAAAVVLALGRESPTEHLLLAPTADQAGLLFDRVVELLDRTPGGSTAKVRRSPYPSLRLGPHVVRARSGHVPRALRGHEATHIVVDEAAFLPESLVTEVALPMLATTGGQITLISTPRGKNHFWRFFEMGQRGENGVWSRRAPTSESPFVSASFLEVQRDLVSERAFAVEYEAEFLDSSGQVFPTEQVEACLVPSLPPLAGPFLIGVDWARYSDYTAVAVLSGHREEAWLAEVLRFHGVTWSETVRRVASVVERFPGARVSCDATGVGDPMVEALRQALPGHFVEGLTFTAGVKASLIDGLAWLVGSRGLRMLPDPQLLREMEHFESTATAHGQRLEARSGYHDDLVVALALGARLLPRPYRPTIVAAGPRLFTDPDPRP